MFTCWWQSDGFEAWRLRGDLRRAARRWQHRLGDELWLWLNTEGEGVVWGKEHRIFLKQGLFGWFAGHEGEDWKWTRLPGQHEAEILVVPRAYLLERFGAQAQESKTDFAKWLRGEKGVAFAGLMSVRERQLARNLAAGWTSKTLPSTRRNELDRFFTSLLGRKKRSQRVLAAHPPVEVSTIETADV